jgi:hypothetical protein
MSNYVPPTTPIGGQPQPPIQPQPSKSKWWVWLLAGCGTFVLLSIIAVVLGGWFVWNKAKEAGLDPELMEKNPALATAKLIAAANPDVEIVSVDDKKGLITIKDKKSGETVTINFEDAQRGKISFNDGDKNQVSIEAKEGDEPGSVVVTSEKGSVKIGAGSPDKGPDWLPLYPGSTQEGTFSAQGADGLSGTYQFTTTDSIKTVMEFYETALKADGFKISTSSWNQNDKAGASLNAQDSTKKQIAVISALTEGAGTRVTVSYNVKN